MSNSKVSTHQQCQRGWEAHCKALRGLRSCCCGEVFSVQSTRDPPGLTGLFGWTPVSRTKATEVCSRAFVSKIWDTQHTLWATGLNRAEAQRLSIKGNTQSRVSEVSQPCSRRDLLEVQDSEEEQLSKGSSLVMVRKLIKWRKVMEIGFKPLATFLLR